MECPQCEEEPIKVFGGSWTGGVGIWKSLQGYLKCVNCDALLKKSRGKPFWVSLYLLMASFILAVLSYFAIISAYEYSLFDPSILGDWFGWVSLGSSVGVLVFLAAVAYTSVLFLEFEKVDSQSM